mgnify:CR=1 FL=1
MRHYMLLFLLAPLLVTGCALWSQAQETQDETPLLPAELRVFYNNGTQYYTCTFKQSTVELLCHIAPSEPHQPKCL